MRARHGKQTCFFFWPNTKNNLPPPLMMPFWFLIIFLKNYFFKNSHKWHFNLKVFLFRDRFPLTYHFSHRNNKVTSSIVRTWLNRLRQSLFFPLKGHWTSIYLFIYLFVLIYKPGETIQCAALLSHGTQVAMFSRKCRAGISPRPVWGGIPEKKSIKQKIMKTATLSKRATRKQAQKEKDKN